jgi:hypothetical protein
MEEIMTIPKGNRTATKQHRHPTPPDPEGMNFDRAAWADKAISAFRKETKVEMDTALRNPVMNSIENTGRGGTSLQQMAVAQVFRILFAG